ncbi:MAG: phycobiliprotein lyase [Phormidium sp. SL48-SHIP]|nr:MAG: phycobiliprotein lyase [Phormidium sp. SL48-SHIP]
MELKIFQEFFDCCVGHWSTERTYHYMTRQEVERSHTDFVVHPLANDLKRKVLTDNSYALSDPLDPLPGYHLEFATISETGENVQQQLNLMFIPTVNVGDAIEGDYLRDRAYEEDRPIISHFRFHNSNRELLMTTRYSRVIAVDSIILINPELRIRKIITYERPETDQPPEKVVLVGFGVEQKIKTTAMSAEKT